MIGRRRQPQRGSDSRPCAPQAPSARDRRRGATEPQPPSRDRRLRPWNPRERAQRHRARSRGHRGRAGAVENSQQVVALAADRESRRRGRNGPPAPACVHGWRAGRRARDGRQPAGRCARPAAPTPPERARRRATVVEVGPRSARGAVASSDSTTAAGARLVQSTEAPQDRPRPGDPLVFVDAAETGAQRGEVVRSGSRSWRSSIGAAGGLGPGSAPWAAAAAPLAEAPPRAPPSCATGAAPWRGVAARAAPSAASHSRRGRVVARAVAVGRVLEDRAAELGASAA
jgi:hypothetical protein